MRKRFLGWSSIDRIISPDPPNRALPCYLEKPAKTPSDLHRHELRFSLRKSVKPEGTTSGEFLHQALLLEAAEKRTGRMRGNPEGLRRFVS
jgi:hypothetical protein